MSKNRSFKAIKVDDLYFFEGDSKTTLIVSVVNGAHSRVSYAKPVQEVADHFKLPMVEIAAGQLLGVNFNNIGDLRYVKRSNVCWIEGTSEETMVVSHGVKIDGRDITGHQHLTFPVELIAAHFEVSTMKMGQGAFGINFDKLDSIYAAQLENGMAKPIDPHGRLSGVRFRHVRGPEYCRSGQPKSALFFQGGTVLYTCFSPDQIEQMKCTRPPTLARTIAELGAKPTYH